MTRIDMPRENQDYPDDPTCTRHMREMLSFTIVGGFIVVPLLIYAVLQNADAIDKFFQEVYKFLTL